MGAGPSGLGTAARLRKLGVEPVVLEAAERVGASWRERYDSLRLNTIRWLSHQPGLRIPREHGRWVRRDDYVRYLERYVAHHALEVRLRTAVERVDREEAGGEWRVRLPDGDLAAPAVVVSTGFNRVPFVPPWPGRDRFGGELLHAASYRAPGPFRERSVMVVGAGNTAGDIATELARRGAREVLLSVRTSPNITPRELLGMPLHPIAVLSRRSPAWTGDRIAWAIQRAVFGDLRALGVPRPEVGLYTAARERGRSPIVDDGFVAELKAGRIRVVPDVERLDGEEVVLSGGETVRPDAVIAATGYRAGLEGLVGHLGVLDAAGLPRVLAGRADPGAPGLRFVGYVSPLSGLLLDARRESRRAARELAATLHAGRRAREPASTLRAGSSSGRVVD